MSQTETIELFGIALEVDFEYIAPDCLITDVRHKGESILQFMDDNSFSRIRTKLARGEDGKA